MRPVLFKLNLFGSLVEVGSYRFFLINAAMAGIALAWFIAKRRGLPTRQSLVLLLAAAAAVPVGSRLLHIATNYQFYSREPARMFSLNATGFALFGGLSLAVVVGLVACRALKLDLWRTADSVIPGLGVAMATVRVGCFLDGCCLGMPSSLPWAIIRPNPGATVLAKQSVNLPLLGGALRAAAAPMATHPVDIYELIAALTGVALVAFILRLRAPDGTAFLAFVSWYSLFRLANHPLRVPAATFGGPDWFYPALYAATLILAGLLIWRRYARTASSVSPGSISPVPEVLPAQK